MKNLLFITAAVLLLTSCNPKKNWDRKAIEEKEKGLMEQVKKNKIDTAGVGDLLSAYEGYADNNPGDTVGANYLFKAADFYRYLHKPSKCIALYQKLYENYPNFEKRPYALFLQGFIFENDEGIIDSARQRYQAFLNIYPDHPLAKDVRITMNHLGKTPEQLIEEFEARQKADSSAQAKTR